MLIVKVHNDGTGTLDIGHYDVEVLITVDSRTLVRLASARIEDHIRSNGWRQLLRRVADEAVDAAAPMELS